MSQINLSTLNTSPSKQATNARPLNQQGTMDTENMEKILQAQQTQDKIHIALHDEELKQARDLDDQLTNLYMQMRLQLNKAFEFNIQRSDYPLEVQVSTTKGYLHLCYNQLDEIIK